MTKMFENMQLKMPGLRTSLDVAVWKPMQTHGAPTPAKVSK